jgi:hypothetical protein
VKRARWSYRERRLDGGRGIATSRVSTDGGSWTLALCWARTSAAFLAPCAKFRVGRRPPVVMVRAISNRGDARAKLVSNPAP